MINIDRCYCEEKTFQSLLDIARVAYLRRALQTGETAFDYLLNKEPIEPAPQPAEEQKSPRS